MGSGRRHAGNIGPGDPFEKVPELSRRARGVPVWAALRSLGRDGTIALVDRLAADARALADGLRSMPGVKVLNEVVFTQVCVSFDRDARTRRVTQQLIAHGSAWMSGSLWHDLDILRISVRNWSTDAADVAFSLAAVKRACATMDGAEDIAVVPDLEAAMGAVVDAANDIVQRRPDATCPAPHPHPHAIHSPATDDRN
ncbi:hypothetical protein CLE01_12950 [Cryobacterium levicorallinum]|uniref:Aspartate aminotransferase family protein n=1 Tax=Cryobacterium levicorallinum TaxID=995038 RepID=A0ABY1ECW7_9MICO|nr:hypothetical protein CLE01_12950 [Cryobacterium levicorallinum]SFH47308.1 hypothetical protein SAMN05216274_10620 [Cryobacterium levicorallinum]